MATVSWDGAAPGGRLRHRREAIATASTLAGRFADTMTMCGLTRETTSAAGVSGEMSPTCYHVELGGTPYLMVRLVPGQVIDDFTDNLARIAAGLGVERVEIEQRRQEVLRIWLNPVDPLAQPFEVPAPVSSGTHPVTFGRLETGRPVVESLDTMGMLACQGQTRGGKSSWSYGLLRQVSGASEIEVSGIDPTGKLLGPWDDGHPQGVDLCTSSDYTAMEKTSQLLVEEMRDRIAKIPRDEDKLGPGSGVPLRLVVLEEWADALTIASIAKNKANGRDTELGRNIATLLSQSHKARMRVVMLCQRFDAALVGGFNRNNFSHAITFRTRSKDGVQLLHESCPDHIAQRHATEKPGIALVETPTVPLQRMLAPGARSYRSYVEAVDASRPGAQPAAA